MKFLCAREQTLISADLQEELAGILATYERRGYFDEVLALMEAGLSLERAHVSHLRQDKKKQLMLIHMNRWVSLLSCRSFIASIGQRNVRDYFSRSESLLIY